MKFRLLKAVINHELCYKRFRKLSLKLFSLYVYFKNKQIREYLSRPFQIHKKLKFFLVKIYLANVSR